MTKLTSICSAALMDPVVLVVPHFLLDAVASDSVPADAQEVDQTMQRVNLSVSKATSNHKF